mmetsp:Transcript_4654/g.14170  ORF Transcript_4654/g.14170 Transcript_4654/m.14170 type:complete len:131 (-) Transcript_4654:433-825(-)
MGVVLEHTRLALSPVEEPDPPGPVTCGGTCAGGARLAIASWVRGRGYWASCLTVPGGLVEESVVEERCSTTGGGLWTMCSSRGGDARRQGGLTTKRVCEGGSPFLCQQMGWRKSLRDLLKLSVRRSFRGL